MQCIDDTVSQMHCQSQSTLQNTRKRGNGPG